MASKEINGYFYNAFPNSAYETGYDRNYDADSFSKWLQTIITTGVIKTDNEAGTGNPQGFMVSAGEGLSVNVNAGFACVRGKPCQNPALVNLTLEANGTGEVRYDYIVLRTDNTQTSSARKTYLMSVTGTSSIPTVSQLQRDASDQGIYDLMLAYIPVQPSASSVSQVIDTRGDADLCPWVTAVKGYEDYYDAIVQEFRYNAKMPSAGRLVTTDLASSLWNAKYSLIEVYTNGMREAYGTDYSVSVSGGYIAINFTAQKSAGTDILVVLGNFIDGEGLSSVMSQYNELVADVAELKQADANVYVCNGINDNVQITDLVNAFIDGGTDYGSMRLRIVGNFGSVNGSYIYTTGGSGTSASPYIFFNFHSGNREVILDFTDCSDIETPVSGVYLNVFQASNVKVIGMNLIANGSNAGTSIKVFSQSSTKIVCEDCRFYITSYLDSLIAYSGTFTNCRGSVANVASNSYCYLPLATAMLRVYGGEYYAYTGDNTRNSAITGQSASGAVCILYAVSAPTLARSGFYQKNSVLQLNTGNWVNCTDLVSELPLSVKSGYSNIRGTIALSKPNSI